VPRALVAAAFLAVALAGVAPAIAAQADPAAPDADAPFESGPRLTLRGFSDVSLSFRDEDRPLTFSLGQFDLFLTSSLADDVSVVAEIVFEFEEDDNEVVLDVERVLLRYAPSDRFTLTIGRMHTPLGYWNQTFHHGAWLQTTAHRPILYHFEDEGGVLPVHQVGVQMAGTFGTRPGSLKYSLSVSNGRGRTPTEIANVQDASDDKAVNVLAGFAPTAVPGLELALVGYFDTIPAAPELGRLDTISERILGGAFVYSRKAIELLAEGSRIRHRHRGDVFETWGGYLQAAWKRERWAPYYRFDHLDVPEGEPFLEAESITRHTAGLRLDPTHWAAVKGEYHLDRRAGRTHSSAVVQAAFTF
jgi:hypothetical protein